QGRGAGRRASGRVSCGTQAGGDPATRTPCAPTRATTTTTCRAAVPPSRPRPRKPMSLTRPLLHLAIILGVLGTAHFYVWRRVVVPAALPHPWGRIATIVLFGMLVLIPVMFLTLRTAPHWFVKPVTWTVFLWMGFFFYLLVFALIGDILRGSA